LRVAFYGRVSTEEQADRGNITNQVEFAKKYFDLHGPSENIEGYEMYLDEGVSGTVPLEERPEGARLLADAQGGKFVAVYFYRLDRLARSTQIVLNTYNDLEKQNISIKSMTEAFDTGTPVGKFFMTLLASIAALERDTILERTQLGKERKAREGYWTSGPPPYGYRIGDDGRLEIHEPEAGVVRTIFRLYKQNMHMNEIANYLNARNIPTPINSKGFKIESNGFWLASHISIILRKTVYYGEYQTMLRSRKKKEGVKIEVPPIIQSEQFHDVNQLIERNLVNLRGSKGKRSYSLRGLIFCGNCGYAMVGNTKASGIYYRCNNRNNNGTAKCNNKQIKAEPIENAIWQEIVHFIKNPDTVMKLIKDRVSENEINTNPVHDELKEVEQAIFQKKSARARVISMVSRGSITENEAEPELMILSKDLDVLNRRRNELFTILEFAQSEKSSAADIAVALDKYRYVIENMSPLEEIVRLLVEKIEVFTDERGGKRVSRVVVHYRFSPHDTRGLYLSNSVDAQLQPPFYNINTTWILWASSRKMACWREF